MWFAWTLPVSGDRPDSGKGFMRIKTNYAVMLV